MSAHKLLGHNILFLYGIYVLYILYLYIYIHTLRYDLVIWHINTKCVCLILLGFHFDLRHFNCQIFCCFYSILHFLPYQTFFFFYFRIIIWMKPKYDESICKLKHKNLLLVENVAFGNILNTDCWNNARANSEVLYVLWFNLLRFWRANKCPLLLKFNIFLIFRLGKNNLFPAQFHHF